MRSLLIFLVGTLCACATLPKTLSSSPLPGSREISTSLETTWSTPVPGVETATSDSGELSIFRIDTKVVRLVLRNTPPSENRSVRYIAAQRGMIIAINAAMFRDDYKTSIGYMRSFGHVNNSMHSTKLKGYVMFHPKNEGVPQVYIGDQTKIDEYNTVFQSHRMWTPEDGILWSKGRQFYYNIGLIGADHQGRALLFFHRATIDVHDLVAQILDLSLDLVGLLYLDGGNHGVLHLDPKLGKSINDRIDLPNILGVQIR